MPSKNLYYSYYSCYVVFPFNYALVCSAICLVYVFVMHAANN